MRWSDPELDESWNAGWWLLLFTLTILFGWALVTLAYLEPLG